MTKWIAATVALVAIAIPVPGALAGALSPTAVFEGSYPFGQTYRITRIARVPCLGDAAAATVFGMWLIN